MAETLKGNTGDPPYAQFEVCKKKGINCQYVDNVNGLCIWERCLYDESPPTTLLWYYECVICKEIDCADPRELKVPFCKVCVGRMNAVEALPVNCRWCGKSIDSPPSWMFSGLCESCLGKIREAAACAHCGRHIP